MEHDPVTEKEVIATLHQMQRGKAKDDMGIIIEMLKDRSSCLVSAIAGLFDDVVSSGLAAKRRLWKGTEAPSDEMG